MGGIVSALGAFFSAIGKAVGLVQEQQQQAAGAAEQKSSDQAVTIAAEERMKDADANGPRTGDDAAQRLPRAR